MNKTNKTNLKTIDDYIIKAQDLFSKYYLEEAIEIRNNN